MTLTLTVTADNAQEMASVLQTLGGNAIVTLPAVQTTAQPKKEVKAAPVKEPVKEAVKEIPAETTSGDSTLTIEQVREAATRQIQADKKDSVKALLTDFGVAKVTELQPAQYAFFLEKVNAL